MNDVDVTALRKLHETATPGPWRYNPFKHNRGEEAVFAGPVGKSAITICATGPLDDPQSMADADYIAALGNAAPTLLDAAEALERVRTRCHELGIFARDEWITNDGFVITCVESVLDEIIAAIEGPS